MHSSPLRSSDFYSHVKRRKSKFDQDMVEKKVLQKISASKEVLFKKKFTDDFSYRLNIVSKDNSNKMEERKKENSNELTTELTRAIQGTEAISSNRTRLRKEENRDSQAFHSPTNRQTTNYILSFHNFLKAIGGWKRLCLKCFQK